MIFAGLEWLRHWPHSVFSGPERILTHTLVTGHSGLVVTFNSGFQWTEGDFAKRSFLNFVRMTSPYGSIVIYLICWG